MQFLDKALKSVLVAGFAAAFAIGMVGHSTTAQAQGLGDNWEVDQSGVSTGGLVSNIDFVDFSYFAVVEQENDGLGPSGGLLDGDMFFEEGFLVWSSYRGDNTLPLPGSELISEYNVYGVFSASGTASINSLGQIEVTFDTFEINFYVDPSSDTTFTLSSLAVDPNANVGAIDISPVVVNDGNGDDALIATATMLGTSDALLLAGLNNGSFEVILTDFGEDFLDVSFFSDPVPFYTIMNLDGVTTDVDPAGSGTEAFVSELTGSGNLFFTAIPEPSTLGLFGIGLIAFGFVMTRRQRRGFAFTG